jgi:predicted AAA+ superfamily ATPase
MQLLFRSSGNLIEVTQLSKMSGLTRPTAMSYLEAMRIANMVYLLPPFHGGGRREITQRPKCYTFDTGFVCFVNGWNEIRENDRGLLWEHLVLDLMRTYTNRDQLFYWRDKSGREIDFVLKKPGNTVDIIECKVNPDHLALQQIHSFRKIYPNGNNYCFSPYIDDAYSLEKNQIRINFTGKIDDILKVGT